MIMSEVHQISILKWCIVAKLQVLLFECHLSGCLLFVVQEEKMFRKNVVISLNKAHLAK